MQFKRRNYPAKKFFLYVACDGSQYLPEDTKIFDELTDVPDEIDCFEFGIQVLPASFAINASHALTEMMIAAQNAGNASQSSAAKSNELALLELTSAIGYWNLVDENAKPVPITVENIKDLEPGWMYSAIQRANDMVNSAKNLPSA